MGLSPAHKFGQILGEVLENAIRPILQQFAKDHGLYLDMKGERPCRTGRKCSWKDHNGNTHDLDFVLERGGSPDKQGIPVAFVETAWRRYTKHSRNKAQEIQGAIEPLAVTYQNSKPFKGAVLAGEFTSGATTQLTSLGFAVLYFTYDSVVTAFRKFRIDAAFDESTLDSDFQLKVESFARLTEKQRNKISAAIVARQASDVQEFISALAVAVSRQIDRILILALHGQQHIAMTVNDAISFIEGYSDQGRTFPVDRYEIEIRYNNSDVISGRFKEKDAAIEFLRAYQPIVHQ